MVMILRYRCWQSSRPVSDGFGPMSVTTVPLAARHRRLLCSSTHRIDMKIENPAEPLQDRQILAQMVHAAGPVFHQMEASASDSGLSQCRQRFGLERGVYVRDAARRIA